MPVSFTQITFPAVSTWLYIFSEELFVMEHFKFFCVAIVPLCVVCYAVGMVAFLSHLQLM